MYTSACDLCHKCVTSVPQLQPVTKNSRGENVYVLEQASAGNRIHMHGKATLCWSLIPTRDNYHCFTSRVDVYQGLPFFSVEH